MDPSRKRTIRLVVALTAALLLTGALAVTSFSASSEARTPKELSNAVAGESYQLTGKVAKGSYERRGDVHTFRVQERNGAETVPVTYTGSVPDAFREGREVIITVQKGAAGGAFVGEKDSLITKCPSKFSAKDEAAAAR
ncbi:MAG TPA: cytochrome c maturation protein CcmE [Solirubrobacteraceae bacterium]|nr:cytochrome c maturation protein CcmE [Solirubrobacteraceae bacterium]